MKEYVLKFVHPQVTIQEEAKEIIKRLNLKKNSDLIIQVKLKVYNIKKKRTGCKFAKYENVGYPENICEKIVWSSSSNHNKEKSK